MISRFFGWLLSVICAFSLGAGLRSDAPADSELQQKVQSHMDVIVDESAAMVDDVAEEIRKNENVQKAEEFRNDVQEIVDNTVADIHAHFDPEKETEEPAEEPVEAIEEETEQETVTAD